MPVLADSKQRKPASRMTAERKTRANEALAKSGIDHTIEGDVDVRALTRAISTKFPKTMKKLAEN